MYEAVRDQKDSTLDDTHLSDLGFIVDVRRKLCAEAQREDA